MKKIYRFMGLKELEKLTSGAELKHVGHFNACTDSDGFCFLPEDVKFFFNGEENVWKPEWCISFFLEGEVQR